VAVQLVGPPEGAFSPKKMALLQLAAGRHAGRVARPRHTSAADGFARVNRASLTPAEARMWSLLKGSQTGVRFRRQVPVGPWIADFASLQIRLVIEVDDTSHQWRDEWERTGYFESVGFRILRFTNREVAFHFDQVHRTIDRWVAALRRGRDPETWDQSG
jgi:very-short-patch-repair endonuclease